MGTSSSSPGTSGEVVGTVPAGIVYIEGQRRWTENSVLDERLKLARDGVVVVIASTRRDEYGVMEEPEVMSAGFAGVDGDSAKDPRKSLRRSPESPRPYF